MILASVLRWGCLLLLVVVGAWFAKSVNHFDRNSPRRPMLLALLLVSLAAMIGTLVAVIRNSDIPAWRFIVAALMALFAAGVFRSALAATRDKSLSLAFSRATPPQVVETGPYAYVRHPLYSAYMIFWIGCALLSGNLFVAVAVAVIVVLYVIAARGEERDIMHTDLAAAYGPYRARTGMLVPNPFRRR